MGMATMANKKMLFVTFEDRAKRFKAHSSQFFADFDLFIVLTSFSDASCRDLVIYVVTTDGHGCFTPAHAHGVKKILK